MHKLATLPTLLALAIGLAACASKPNENLDQARSAFNTLQSDPRSMQLAALETQDAGQRLNDAEMAYMKDASEERVDQLAYLAMRSTEIAAQTIALREAEQQMADIDKLRTQARLETREAELMRQQEEIRMLRESLNARPTERGTLVTFGDVLFNLDSAQVRPEGMRDIEKLAGFLRAHPGRMVVIEGYTDSSGPDSYNQGLSERRAQAVERALIKLGVDPALLTTRGYGEQFPVADNGSPSGRAMNRRVEVTISDSGAPVRPRGSMQSGNRMGSEMSGGGMSGAGMSGGPMPGGQGMGDMPMREREMLEMREYQQQRMREMTPEQMQEYREKMQRMTPQERHEYQRMQQEQMMMEPKTGQ